MAFNSERGGESADSKYVCICERGSVLGAYEGWAVFSFTFVDVYSPSTSIESFLARKGVVEYACIVWSELVVLASCRIRL